MNLTVHGIGPCPRRLDPGEDRVWISTELFEQLLCLVAERPYARLTFDDANVSDVAVALPKLLEHGLQAAFFLVADRLDRPGFLSRQDARALAEAGMAVGNHGKRHCGWRGLAHGDLVEEITVAREELESAVGQAVAEAACPFGLYDRRALRLLRSERYARVYTSDGGPAKAEAWLQPRRSVQASDSARKLSSYLDGAAQKHAARMIRSTKMVVKRWR